MGKGRSTPRRGACEQGDLELKTVVTFPCVLPPPHTSTQSLEPNIHGMTRREFSAFTSSQISAKNRSESTHRFMFTAMRWE